jgi:hypothetical protein
MKPEPNSLEKEKRKKKRGSGRKKEEMVLVFGLAGSPSLAS